MEESNFRLKNEMFVPYPLGEFTEVIHSMTIRLAGSHGLEP